MLSLLAEYGDDDDADADDHEDPAFPQLDEDNDDADNGMDILDEDAGLSGEHTPKMASLASYTKNEQHPLTIREC